MSLLKKYLVNDGVELRLDREIIGGFGTFLTLSYIFLLNPILLSQAGMPLSAAFFATVLSAALSTLFMAFYARLPFAVAPAPSITTFFVGYVCLTLGIEWQVALAAVVVSGVLSVIMAILAVRAQLISAMPAALKYGILLSLCGFLLGNGLFQAGLVDYSGTIVALGQAFDQIDVLRQHAIILAVGLGLSVVLAMPPFNFRGSPIVGILAATGVASSFGILLDTQTSFSDDMFATFFQADFLGLFSSAAILSIIVIFIIDFFGGVGKFVGLFAAMGVDRHQFRDKELEKSLSVDGVGNMIGGFLGASSLAVFISSAVGIKAGARTGVAAVVVAALMLASFVFIPLVGSIPRQATSGILIYIAFILVPWNQVIDAFKNKSSEFSKLDFLIGVSAFLISFLSFSIDKSLAVLFVVYSLLMIRKGFKVKHSIFYITTILLSAAVLFQEFT